MVPELLPSTAMTAIAPVRIVRRRIRNFSPPDGLLHVVVPGG